MKLNHVKMKYLLPLFFLITSCKSKENTSNDKAVIEEEDSKYYSQIKTDSISQENPSRLQINQETHELIKDTFVLSIDDTIKLSSYKREFNAWNGAPGAIIVEREERMDTLFDGQFGNPPDLKVLNNGDYNFLLVSSTINGGGNNIESVTLLSLNRGNYLDTLYSENISISSEKLNHDRGSYTFCHKDLSIQLLGEFLLVEIDSTCKDVDETSYEEIGETSRGKREKRIKIEYQGDGIHEVLGLDCHGCNGLLVFKKFGHIDTLKTGAWGRAGRWHRMYHKNNEFFFQITTFFSGGITESHLSLISLNEKDYLEHKKDTLISDEYLSRLSVRKNRFTVDSEGNVKVTHFTIEFNDQDESSDTIKIEVEDIQLI